MTALDPRSRTGVAAAGSERHAHPAAVERGSSRSAVSSRLRAYLSITKPRVVELLLVTTVPSMVLAQRGIPPVGLVLATLAGGALAAGSAHAFNQVIERDIDAIMVRTAHRPLATNEISTGGALTFGAVLVVVAVALMFVVVNPLAALLTAGANAFYVLVYTVLLKRRTAQNIVWGGMAGCMPTLIGWAAVTGELAWAPIILFLIVFFWTPPHYWPLAMRFREDYARAGVPMLPVVATEVAVSNKILIYGWAMVLASAALVPVASMGPVYVVAATVAGAFFLREAYRLRGRALAGRTGAALKPMLLFHGSITYLTVVFLAVAVDAMLG